MASVSPPQDTRTVRTPLPEYIRPVSTDGVTALTKGIELERSVAGAATPRQRVAALIRLALWYADVERPKAHNPARQACERAAGLRDSMIQRRAQYARSVVSILAPPTRNMPDWANTLWRAYHEIMQLGVDFEQQGYQRDAAWCDLVAAIALEQLGDAGGTVLLVDRAMSQFQQLGDVGGQARCVNTLGVQQALSGKLFEALECFSRATELASRGNLLATHALAWTNYVEAWIDIGRGSRSDGRIEEARLAFDVASQQFPALRRQLAALGYRQLEPRMSGLTAVVLAHFGDADRALEEASKALNLSRGAAPEMVGSIRCYVGEVWLTLGKYGRARDMFQAAWQRRAFSRPTEQARVLTGLVASYEALGELTEALRHHRYLLDVQLVARDQRAQREREIARARLGTVPLAASGADERNVLASLERENAQLQAQRAELEKLAFTDAVTGLANRREFDSQLARMAVRAELAQRPLSLIIVDIDKFKVINDTYGHLVGDEVLRRVAATLLGSCRRSDLAARVGGEEFAVLLPGVELPAAIVAAERLCQAVRERVVDDVAAGLQVTVSAGVAGFVAGVSPEQVYEAADDALYRAKETGRDKVCVAPLSAGG